MAKKKCFTGGDETNQSATLDISLVNGCVLFGIPI
jgi:hypothetical protein